MKYRFKKPHRQFRVGDILPEGRDSGTIGTMIASHIIEPIPDPKSEPTPEPDEDDEAIPAGADAKDFNGGGNKAIKTGSERVKRKYVRRIPA